MPKLFPYLRLHNFLDLDSSDKLLNYAIEQEKYFRSSSVSSQKEGRRINPEVRVSMVTRELGDFKALFEQKIRAILPDLFEKLAITSFSNGELELELAAHGDGAFFKYHIDTLAHSKDTVHSVRVMSAVYYFHHEPKSFSSGQLRLHPLPIKTGNDENIDINPDHNTLVVFPSLAPHEVLPIHCPDNAFKNWRFAVNCWIHKVT